MDDILALEVCTKANAKFKIGEKEFIMKPIVPKKLRELVQLIQESGKDLENFSDLGNIVNFISKKVTDIFPILFDATITKDFAEDYMSIPVCREIWNTFIKLNTLEDILPFFQKVITVKEVQINEKK